MDTLGRLRRIKPLQAAPWIGMAAMGVLTVWALRRPRDKPSLSDDRVMPPEAFEKAEPGRGRAARRLRDIPARGWRDIAWRTLLEIPRDRLPIVAGGITFFSLLAIVPMLSAFVATYGMLADVNAVQEQIGQLAQVFPPAVVDVIGTQMLRLAETGGATLSLTFAASLLVALWSAGAGINALIDGLNIAYGEPEKRNWFKRRALVTGFTFAALVFFALISLLVVAVPLAVQARYGLIPSDYWWVPFRWLLAAVLVAFALGVLYRHGPCRSLAQPRWVWLGALAASVAWLAGSLVYSAFITQVTDFERVYGPLGAAVGFMVWIWFSVMVVLLGAEFASEIEHQTAADTTTGPEMPMGQRGAAVADSVGLAFTGFNVKKVKAEEKKVKIWSTLRKTPR